MKRCSRCRETKPLDEFGRNRANRDGKHHYCKPCACALAREQRKRHPEKHKERRARWYAENPGKRTAEKTRAKKKARALGKAWAFESPVVVRERSKKWQRENAEHRSAYMKAWRAANPGYDNHRRRDPDNLTYAAALLADPCCYCGDPATDLDHIVPRASGGDGDWSNLTAACRSCNASKNDRSLLTFLT